jgi:hypothetical protein
MKRFASLFVAVGLATAGSTALADQGKSQVDKPASKPQPVKMTNAQMDNVAGGALINAVLVDVVDVNNNNVQVAIPVNASVAAGILGTAGSAALQQPGRQIATQ